MYSENHSDIAYNEFLIFSKAYDSAFPEIQTKIKIKILSPWITKSLVLGDHRKRKKNFTKKSWQSGITILKNIYKL